MRGLPPGKYELFSWAGLEQGAWEDPEFLKEYVAKATVIEVNEGDTKTVELQLIQMKEAEVAKRLKRMRMKSGFTRKICVKYAWR